MNDIRKYIKKNFKDSPASEIKDAIVESIKDNDEVTLPGLGVFFELIWSNSNDREKEMIINKIKNSLN